MIGTNMRGLCGGAAYYRRGEIDLDQNPPIVISRFEPDGSGYQKAPLFEQRPITFPYSVTVSDAENFWIDATVNNCDCMWILELQWTSEGRSGFFKIDNNGVPFRTTGSKNADAVCGRSGDGWSFDCNPN
jgi:hypothetical protein